MDSKHENLDSAIAASWPPDAWRNVHVVLAVSGGADSVALLRAVIEAKRLANGTGRLYAAHFDHCLRDESEADAAWVAELCRTLEVPCEIGVAHASSSADNRGDGPEAAARRARYAFLLETAEKVGARFVATAHTADDQVETVLHRILRGTGIGGLAGIPPSRPLSPSVVLVRPMLQVSRRQVLDYLHSIDQTYRTDATNADTQFTRNRLRLELLPLLRTINSDVDGAITRLAELADEAQQLIAKRAQQLFQEAGTASPGHAEIACGRLAGEPPLLIRETCKLAWSGAELPLQSMGYGEWQQLAALIDDNFPNVLNLPGDVRAERQGDRLHISQGTQNS